MAVEEKDDQQKQESLVTHLVELRDRLIKIIIGIVVALLALFPFANDIYSFLAKPLLKHLPEQSTMVAIDVASPFLTPFKLVMLLAIVITIPGYFINCGLLLRQGYISMKKNSLSHCLFQAQYYFI